MYAMSQSNQQPSEEVFVQVTGFVQGVGFRYFAVQHALYLGLRGYAHNASDGSVEVLAQGPRPALEHLLSLLRQGPPASDVESVSVSWRSPTEHFRGFNIRW
jgi:acylphosphatase